MQPRISLRHALSTLYAHANKYDADFLIDTQVYKVALGVLRGVHDELFPNFLADAIPVVWEHVLSQTPNLDYFVIEPGGRWDSPIRVVEKEVADE
jgi:hypothetical protein